jgi:hypothetical protein
VLAALVLLGGDGLGVCAARWVGKKCTASPRYYLPMWITYSVAVLIPGAVISGILGILLNIHSRTALETLANNMEMLILAAFSVTGFCGGFFSKINNY